MIRIIKSFNTRNRLPLPATTELRATRVIYAMQVENLLLESLCDKKTDVMNKPVNCATNYVKISLDQT